LLILTPMLRAPCIVLLNVLSQEFSDEIIAAFCKAWANIQNRDDAVYPEWIGFVTEGEVSINNYFTVLLPDTLSDLSPPNALGISSELKAYRFVSQGVEVRFNVPDLVNQASVVMARGPAETSSIVPQREHARGFDEFYLHITSGGSPAITALFPSGREGPPINQLNWSGSFPSPLTISDSAFRNQAGTFSIAVGDHFGYEFIGGLIYLTNYEAPVTRLLIRDISQSPNSTRMYVRESLLDDVDLPIDEIRDDMTQMVLPLITQKDMQAQIVSAASYLMKDYEGVYLPNQNFKPIFEPQEATSYRKIVLVNSLSRMEELDDPTVGWFDSYDKNFGFAVVNIQGMSQVAEPFVKVIRTDEQFPTAKSKIGAYTTRCSAPNSVALDTARCIADKLPMGFPADFNSMGKLFEMVTGVLRKMPVALAHAMNISSQIGHVVDEIEELDVISKNPTFKRRSK